MDRGSALEAYRAGGTPAEQQMAVENRGDQSISAEQVRRPREEMRILMMGFGTGMLIGFFFLVYVVLALGNVLQG